ncbi:hypothetical protein D0T49_04275 [Paludibacter sp. 221]|nr:hypothetical protein [Paludibacter sp. 221]
MACNCIKKNKALEDAVAMAQSEANTDKKTCVVFKQNGKIYHSHKTCWDKEEDKGYLLLVVYPE